MLIQLIGLFLCAVVWLSLRLIVVGSGENVVFSLLETLISVATAMHDSTYSKPKKTVGVLGTVLISVTAILLVLFVVPTILSVSYTHLTLPTKA